MAPVDQELPGAASPSALLNTPKHLPEVDTDSPGASGSKDESDGTASTKEDSDSSNSSGDDSDHGGATSEVDDDLTQGAAALEAQQTEQINSKSKEGSQPNGNENIPSVTDRSVETKAESLAKFIILSLLGKSKNGKSNDKVERTLLRCVKTMMSKHELLFKGMMKRLNITQETGYLTFVSVANELFEGDKMAVNWGRIVALYSFGGQLALHCVESKMEDFAMNIATFMGRYSSEVVAPFVRQSGGWNKLCEEYPEEEDLENKAWNFLTWTAVGLGIVSAVTFFTSH